MSGEALSSLFVTELLNALDDIQQDIPIILDAYLDNELPEELEIDLDLLSTNLTSLRDSAKLTRRILELNRVHPPALIQTDDIVNNMAKYKSIGLAMFLHIHMLTDETSIYYANSFADPFNNDTGACLNFNG